MPAHRATSYSLTIHDLGIKLPETRRPPQHRYVPYRPRHRRPRPPYMNAVSAVIASFVIAAVLLTLGFIGLRDSTSTVYPSEMPHPSPCATATLQITTMEAEIK